MLLIFPASYPQYQDRPWPHRPPHEGHPRLDLLPLPLGHLIDKAPPPGAFDFDSLFVSSRRFLDAAKSKMQPRSREHCQSNRGHLGAFIMANKSVIPSWRWVFMHNLIRYLDQVYSLPAFWPHEMKRMANIFPHYLGPLTLGCKDEKAGKTALWTQILHLDHFSCSLNAKFLHFECIFLHFQLWTQV